ncbi:hypothetical protein D9X30_0578 [Cupriavidus sp. U2]|uniref:zinc ribbon domain-containing protein n=1 Tax=Cupriavidus sp. U2 TaxID=2920269 RepID=UPI00129D6F2B|nr:zinc ribbon domain-containing protein [Cupriavidus sp. U2]KAI3594346.1 hypothetical protein D9X30_0578 [Cupriavidus sp. U2]
MNALIDKKASSEELESTLQQRADFIPIEDLAAETAQVGDLFGLVQKELTNRGLRTIVGPRGCGKTHLMRFAWLSCRDTPTKPFAVYASFLRYFRLEPLLSSRAGALQYFHSWVLARVLLAAVESAKAWKEFQPDWKNVFLEAGLHVDQLAELVSRIERQTPLGEEMEVLSTALSIDKTLSILDALRVQSGRKFTVLLMDDAALSLTPEYLVEFLDIVRSLKSITVAPKASVYPGTTEVSPRFHEGQDTVSTSVWISVESDQYHDAMRAIAQTRVSQLSEVPADVQELLRFAAFGIPRAYLTMLEEYLRGAHRTTQQRANSVVSEHLEARRAEFRSIAKKVPKLERLIETGEKVLDGMCRELKLQNQLIAGRDEKQWVVGVESSELTPMVERMFKLLVEAGLVFDEGRVKHGTPERIYQRYIPHLAVLLGVRAFSSDGKGGSIKQSLAGLARKRTKHPLRKSLSKFAPKDELAALQFALPRCANCHERRLADNQKFCHHCGHQLVDASAFNECLKTPIISVPGLTAWQKERISKELPAMKTLGDYAAKQDPAADLLKIFGFGDKRTAKVVDVLESFMDDYLS